MSIVNETRVLVQYKGGVNGLTTALEFHCDHAIELGVIRWEEIADQVGNVLTIHLYTKEVCKKAEWGQIKGGSVFLLLVYLFVLLYFGLGSFVKWFLTGNVDLLNEEFWAEVWGSLAGAVKFIVSCGSERPTGHLYRTVNSI
jgi:hypothetical protein